VRGGEGKNHRGTEGTEGTEGEGKRGGEEERDWGYWVNLRELRLIVSMGFGLRKSEVFDRFYVSMRGTWDILNENFFGASIV